jgi:epoxyqueuosine reductase
MGIKELIIETIKEKVEACGADNLRTPLVGFASAQDPIFQEFKGLISEDYRLPTALLPEAKTVVAFFVPFTKEVTNENRGGKMATENWAKAYVNTNKIISEVCLKVQQVLAEEGVNTGWQPPTYQFDKVKLISSWSHKHTAYACGLGTFGLNHLLITEKGCGGRFGSFVIDAFINPSPRKAEAIQCFHHSKSCTYCIDKCPVGALSTDGFDRHLCYSHCQENDQLYSHLGSCEVCGKCCTGPCTYVE